MNQQPNNDDVLRETAREFSEKYIYPERLGEWTECVDGRISGMYNGMDLKDAMDVMRIIGDTNDFKFAQQKLDDQQHSGYSYSMVISMIAKFSKKGPEFVRYADPRRCESAKSIEFLHKIEEENIKYARQEERRNAEKANDTLFDEFGKVNPKATNPVETTAEETIDAIRHSSLEKY